MRSTNRKRALLISSSIVLLCMSVIAGMTWALFTDTETVNHHLQAGELDITLQRTKLVSTYLTPQGFLDTKTDETVKDFSNGKNEDDNVFDLDTVIVPQSKYVADMKITNQGDVAFLYWIEIKYNGTSDLDLAKQLEIIVKTDDDNTERLSKGLIVGSVDDPVGILAVGEDAGFTVSVEFLDSDTTDDIVSNDSAQCQSLDFDLIVHAVQVTSKPTTEQTTEQPTEQPGE